MRKDLRTIILLRDLLPMRVRQTTSRITGTGWWTYLEGLFRVRKVNYSNSAKQPALASYTEDPGTPVQRHCRYAARRCGVPG